MDLTLLGQEFVDEITALGIERDEPIDAERAVRQICRNSRIDRARFIFLHARMAQMAVERARKRLVGLAVLADLRRDFVEVLQTLRRRKQAVEIVEAAILQVQHHDMLDAVEADRRSVSVPAGRRDEEGNEKRRRASPGQWHGTGSTTWRSSGR